MSNLYKRIPVEEGALTECVGVHVIRWQSEWGEPTYAFVRDDETSEVEALRDRIATLEAQLRWIPVGEGLPNRVDSYLTIQSDLWDRQIFAILTFRFGKFGTVDDQGDTQFAELVTHWMPLPNPPEEVSNE
jgi:hypothetical protein